MKDWFSITLNQSYYHLVNHMCHWCSENVDTEKWARTDEMMWLLENAFGTTTFFFKDSRDAMLFALRWL
jgi:hypothetical protein